MKRDQPHSHSWHFPQRDIIPVYKSTWIWGNCSISGKMLMLLECATRVCSLLQFAMVVGMVLSLLPLRFSSSNCSNLFSLLKKKHQNTTLHPKWAAAKQILYSHRVQRRLVHCQMIGHNETIKTLAKGRKGSPRWLLLLNPDLFCLSVCFRGWSCLASLTAVGSCVNEQLPVMWLTGSSWISISLWFLLPC